MSVLLKSTYVYVFTSAVILAAYVWWTFGILGIGYFTGPDALVRIGRAIFSLIVFGYAFEFLVLFIVGFFGVKVLKNTKEDFTIDERDKQIVYKSLQHSHLVLCGGLFISVGALALGLGAFWVFNLMVLVFFVSVIAELATKLILYKRGF